MKSQSTNADEHDVYFFGHGHDYLGALQDFVAVSGKTIMTPRYTSGVWWSRWYDVGNFDIKKVVADYESRDIPLDVFVIDMDWHKKNDWSGFTFDDHLFPNAADSMGLLKANGLGITVNVHDASGVNSWEAMFPQLVAALGLPAGTTKVPMNLVNATVAYAVEDIVIGDLINDKKVDFMWRVPRPSLTGRPRRRAPQPARSRARKHARAHARTRPNWIPALRPARPGCNRPQDRLATGRRPGRNDGRQAEPHHVAQPPALHGPPPRGRLDARPRARSLGRPRRPPLPGRLQRRRQRAHVERHGLPALLLRDGVQRRSWLLVARHRRAAGQRGALCSLDPGRRLQRRDALARPRRQRGRLRERRDLGLLDR
jgi:hypothetical protein